MFLESIDFWGISLKSNRVWLQNKSSAKLITVHMLGQNSLEEPNEPIFYEGYKTWSESMI